MLKKSILTISTVLFVCAKSAYAESRKCFSSVSEAKNNELVADLLSHYRATNNLSQLLRTWHNEKGKKVSLWLEGDKIMGTDGDRPTGFNLGIYISEVQVCVQESSKKVFLYALKKSPKEAFAELRKSSPGQVIIGGKVYRTQPYAKTTGSLGRGVASTSTGLD